MNTRMEALENPATSSPLFRTHLSRATSEELKIAANRARSKPGQTNRVRQLQAALRR